MEKKCSQCNKVTNSFYMINPDTGTKVKCIYCEQCYEQLCRLSVRDWAYHHRLSTKLNRALEV